MKKIKDKQRDKFKILKAMKLINITQKIATLTTGNARIAIDLRN